MVWRILYGGQRDKWRLNVIYPELAKQHGHRGEHILMSQTFIFSPSNSTAFTFNPTLDGVIYTATITWNVAGERWYITITDSSGNVILNMPVISSDASYPISMTLGFFNTPLTFNSALSTFTVG